MIDVHIKVYVSAERNVFQSSQVQKEHVSQALYTVTRQNCCQHETLNPMLPAELGTESLPCEIWHPASS